MTTSKIYNATELFQTENSLSSIHSFSQSLDQVLGNKGLQLCTVTELLGLPGTGKTQLCLQLCASVQVPQALGGLNAEALYIDTNTNFTTERFRDVLIASLYRCKELLGISFNINEEDALEKLHYVNAFGLEKYCAFMHRLPKFIADHPHVKLIVIDSIAFPFKEGVSAKQRTGLLFRQMADLQRLTLENQIAVVLTNEMSTRLGLSGDSVVGALGDAWAHRCNVRVLLSTDSEGAGDSGLRVAVCLKSHSMPCGVARFQITRHGIRDID